MQNPNQIFKSYIFKILIGFRNSKASTKISKYSTKIAKKITKSYKFANWRLQDRHHSNFGPFVTLYAKKNPKGGFSAHSGAKKAQKWGFSKKLSKNRQIKSSQVICDPKSQLFMSQFLNFQSETKIGKMTHSAPLR